MGANAWRRLEKGVRGLRFVPARNEPHGWQDPKKEARVYDSGEQGERGQPRGTNRRCSSVKGTTAAAATEAAAAATTSQAAWERSSSKPSATTCWTSPVLQAVQRLRQAGGDARPLRVPAGGQRLRGDCPVNSAVGRSTTQCTTGSRTTTMGNPVASTACNTSCPLLLLPSPELAIAARNSTQQLHARLLPGGNPPKPQVQAQPRPSYGNGQVRAQEAKHWAPVAPFPPAQPIPQPRNAVANGNQDDGGMCARSCEPMLRPAPLRRIGNAKRTFECKLTAQVSLALGAQMMRWDRRRDKRGSARRPQVGPSPTASLGLGRFENF